MRPYQENPERLVRRRIHRYNDAMDINESNNSKAKATARRVAGFLSLAGFAVILACVLTEHTAGFDDPVREFFYSMRSPALTTVAIVITNLANK